jgi:hypothetical protein
MATSLSLSSLEWVPTLGNKHHWHALLLAPLNRHRIVLVKSSINLGHIVTLVSVRDRNVQVRFDLSTCETSPVIMLSKILGVVMSLPEPLTRLLAMTRIGLCELG